MLTRRSLFARLSAVALAPLVKLLPKEEDYSTFCVTVDSTGFDRRWTPEGWEPYHFLDFNSVSGYWEMVESGAMPDFQLFSSVPQEEA